MRITQFVLVSGMIVACLVSSSGNATEPTPTVDSVLAKWEAASRACKTLDAKFTTWKYVPVFGDGEPTIAQGRFYYEAPNVGRYEIRGSSDDTVNAWPALPEVVVWSGKETLWIDGKHRRYCRHSMAEIQSALRKAETAAESGRLQRFGDLMVRHLAGPQHLLPLVVDVRAAEVRERFDLTIQRSDK